jgi:hypothetical protein
MNYWEHGVSLRRFQKLMEKLSIVTSMPSAVQASVRVEGGFAKTCQVFGMPVPLSKMKG